MAKTPPNTGMLVKLTLFIPFARGDLDGMAKAVESAKSLTTKDGLSKIADNVEVIEAVAREGIRPSS